MPAEFDRGPTQAIASICARCPRPSKPQAFWTEWGPVFYRGRLDGSARVLAIASDPGPTERVANRTLVGDAGQRVQGFLAKLGLTKSYLLVNAFPYALHPSFGEDAEELLAEPAQLAWRNEFYDAVKPSGLEAVIAFGGNSQRAVRSLGEQAAACPWRESPIRAAGTAPSSFATGARRSRRCARRSRPTPTATRTARTTARRSVRPTTRRSRDATYPSGPRSSWATTSGARTGRPRHNNSVSRPSPDDGRTLIWIAPKDSH